MDPGQEEDQLEAHSVALPAEESPTLEEHPDDGKDLGKVWSDVFPQMSDDMVSGNHGEESRYSSPPLSVDCATCSSSTQRPQVGLVGNVALVTSVAGIKKKRTKDSDSEEEPPAKKMRNTVDEEELSSKRTRDSDVDEEELPSKSAKPFWERRFGSPLPEAPGSFQLEMSSPPRGAPLQHLSIGAEVEIPAHGSRNSDDEEEPLLSPSTNMLRGYPILSWTVHEDSPPSSPSSIFSAFWVDQLFAPFGLSSQSACEDPTRDELFSKRTIPYWERPFGSPLPSRSSAAQFWMDPSFPNFSLSPLSSPVFSSSPRTPREGPIESVHAISPPVSEDLILSSPVLSRPQSTVCADPIVSSTVGSPSPSASCKIPRSSFPCMCAWMKSQTDIEEEPQPSTSGIGSDGIRERVSARQVWFRPLYDVSSDSE
ncbi:uncharacterized protein LOC129370481 [Poeciliopsis prolifica]|uniref:uncharacterized protein LOC129370481 n=1 Tax=Poeciliopsis prolifica TaxID=188132 RepID=UPI0024132306|nr:uncharacterized protein LOC129370481 [Poeciliopsis prolifica]